MNMLWQGATSKDFYFGDKLQGQGSDYGYLSVIYDFQRDVWTPDNRNAKFPRLRSTSKYNGSNNYGSSDFWLVNTGYIRLKSLNIGYDLKHKYDIDPEIGNTNLYTYPVSRVYSISFNIGF